ncbi:hypothetical protein FOA52_001062 [Chlamydomonas sp. UWO 241]|nr:hypothetical protein FOA52_001062 [Chlamydomonas sp. UWO 241]
MVLSFTLPFNNVSGNLGSLDVGLPDPSQMSIFSSLSCFMAELFLQNNDLSGHIPLSIITLKNAQSLHLNGNRLEGEGNDIFGIESSALSWYLGGARSLRSFSIGGNNLSSLDISGLPANSFIYLTKLDLHNCSLQGSFPAEFSRLSYLSYLNFADNELTGMLPSWAFDNMGMLVQMVGNNNNFNGSMPVPGYSTSLTSLSFGNNQLTGGVVWTQKYLQYVQ